MTASRLLRLVLAAALSVAFLTGCGDDDTSDDASDATAEETDGEDTDSEDTDGEDTDSEDADGEGTDGEDAGAPDEIAQPVTDNYVAFFTNFSGDPALLEDSDSFDPSVLEGMRANAEQTGDITVDVSAVADLSDADCEAAGVIAPCAEVTFDLVVDGTAAVPDQTGYAVYQDDTWKIAKTTFCSLASLSGSTPEGC